MHRKYFNHFVENIKAFFSFQSVPSKNNKVWKKNFNKMNYLSISSFINMFSTIYPLLTAPKAQCLWDTFTQHSPSPYFQPSILWLHLDMTSTHNHDSRQNHMISYTVSRKSGRSLNTESVVWASATLAQLGSFSEMQDLRPYPRRTEQWSTFNKILR